MSELILEARPEEAQETRALVTEAIRTVAGKISVFEALAQESTNVTTSMTWQSAWGNREDR